MRIAVTESPTSEWVARPIAAFPRDSASRRLLEDRDGTYGEKFSGAARWLGIRDVLVRTTIVLADRLCGAIDRQVAGYKLAD